MTEAMSNVSVDGKIQCSSKVNEKFLDEQFEVDWGEEEIIVFQGVIHLSIELLFVYSFDHANKSSLHGNEKRSSCFISVDSSARRSQLFSYPASTATDIILCDWNDHCELRLIFSCCLQFEDFKSDLRLSSERQNEAMRDWLTNSYKSNDKDSVRYQK